MAALIDSFSDFLKLAEDGGITLSWQQQKLFSALLAQYGKWSSKLNFTSIKDPREFAAKHFYDSIAPFAATTACKVSISTGGKLLDIGSGGGFPGMPLAVMFPAVSVTLLEATGKKAIMLQQIISELALKNVLVAHGRAEELGHDANMRDRFDFVVTRALGEWPIVIELALPFLRVGGKLFTYQGPAIKEKLAEHDKQLALLGGMIKGLSVYALPHDFGERIIVEIEKIKETPGKFPRRPAVIKRDS